MAARVTTLRGGTAGRYYVERDLDGRVVPGVGLGAYYAGPEIDPGGGGVASPDAAHDVDRFEPVGRWWGTGANNLDLHGAVQPEAFVALLAGRHPGTGAGLGRPYNDKSARGFDLTFSAPKSVSVLWAAANPDARREVLAGHDAAVDAVLGHIEATMAHTRRGAGGAHIVDTKGLAVGVFRQHTSRLGDPQLHTHAVIAAKVQAASDGRWLALDARALKMDQRTLSALYHTTLRSELTHRLGVTWHTPTNGIAEMAGIPDPVRDAFSARTTTIAARLQTKLDRFETSLGRQPTPRERWKLEREAVLDCRPTKTSHHPTANLNTVVDRNAAAGSPATPAPAAIAAATTERGTAAAYHHAWRTQLQDLGIDPDQLVAATIGRALQAAVLSADPEDSPTIDAALQALTDGSSTWRHADVVRELARAVPTDVATPANQLITEITQLAARFEDTWCVDLAPPVRPEVRRRTSDGRPVTESTVDRRFTTHYILEQEEHLATWAIARWETPNPGPAALGPQHAQGLDKAQHAAAAAAAGHAPLVVIVGPAGAGKTTALQPAVHHLHTQRRAVFGVAPSATAAAVLAEQTGLAADTIAKFVLEHQRPAGPGERWRLPPGGTLIIDEAAMVPTPDLADLARLADHHRWRVVAVGDPAQFGPVGRGGMFEWLTNAGPTITLDQVRRFDNEWERDASLRLRQGDPTVIDLYAQHHRIHGGTPQDIEAQVLAEWRAHQQAGHTVALQTATTDTADRLNHQAQTIRARAGEIDQTSAPASARDGNVWVGDRIATRHNDRTLLTDQGVMVRNRDQWTITAIGPDGAVRAEGRSGRVELPAPYVRAHVELGYATTAHATQGRTVDHSLLLVDGPIDNRGLYVPLTRGRHSNHAYVALDPHQNRTAVDVLVEAATKDWADTAAIVHRAQQAARQHTIDQTSPARPPGRPAPTPAHTPPAPAIPPPAAGNELLSGAELARLLADKHDLDRYNIPTEVARLENARAAHIKATIDLDVARHKLAAARGRVVAASQQLADIDQIGIWRPSRWKNQPHLEQELRDANKALQPVLRAHDKAETAHNKQTQQLADAETWVRDHARHIVRHHTTTTALDRDLGLRAERAATRPPQWATAALGPRPHWAPAAAQAWDQLTAKASQYRDAHDLGDHTAGLAGAAPDWDRHPAQRAAWNTINTAHHNTAPALHNALTHPDTPAHLRIHPPTPTRGIERGFGISR